MSGLCILGLAGGLALWLALKLRLVLQPLAMIKRKVTAFVRGTLQKNKQPLGS